MIPRRAQRRDANEPAIIEALQAVGCTVEQLSLEDGPDLLVGRLGLNYLLEVKRPAEDLSDGQGDWHRDWNGQRATVHTPSEALAAIGFGGRDV